MRNVVLPNMDFTNTQLKTSNTQFHLNFTGNFQIPQKNSSISLHLFKNRFYKWICL